MANEIQSKEMPGTPCHQQAETYCESLYHPWAVTSRGQYSQVARHPPSEKPKLESSYQPNCEKGKLHKCVSPKKYFSMAKEDQSAVLPNTLETHH